MAVNAFELIGKLTLEGIDKAVKQLDGMEKGLQNFSKSAEKAGKSLTKFVTLPLLAVGAAGIKVAADFEVVENKFSTAFKGIEGSAESAAKTLQESFDLSIIQSKKLLSNTGDLLKGFGATADQALDTSLEVQKLAAALGAYNGVPVKESSEAITKALLGETESLKSLGVVIRQSDVQARLLAKGQEELTGQSLLLAKAQIALELSTEQSGDAIASYADNADTTQRQLQRLRATFEDIILVVGQKLIPVFDKILAQITPLVEKFNDLTDEQIESALKWAALAAALGPVLLGLSKLPAILAVIKTSLTFLTGPLGLVTLLVGGLIALGIELDRNTTSLGEIKDAIVDFKDATDELNESLKTAKELTAEGLYSESTKEDLIEIIGLSDKLLTANQLLINKKQEEIQASKDSAEAANNPIIAAAFEARAEKLQLELDRLITLRTKYEAYRETAVTAYAAVEKAEEEAAEVASKPILEIITAIESLDLIVSDLTLDLKELKTATDEEVTSLDAFKGLINTTAGIVQTISDSQLAVAQAFGFVADLGVKAFTDIDAAILNTSILVSTLSQNEIDEEFNKFKILQELYAADAAEQLRLIGEILTAKKDAFFDEVEAAKNAAKEREKVFNLINGFGENQINQNKKVVESIKQLKFSLEDVGKTAVTSATAAFDTLNAALFKSEGAFENYGDAIVASIGQVIGAIGNQVIAQGIALLFTPGGQASGLAAIAAGGGLKLLGAALGAAVESAPRVETSSPLDATTASSDAQTALDERADSITTETEETVVILNKININEEPFLDMVSEGNTNGKIRQKEAS